MNELTIVCPGCGREYELFKEGDSKVCYNCSSRESMEDVYDWLPSITPKVWEKPTPRERR